MTSILHKAAHPVNVETLMTEDGLTEEENVTQNDQQASILPIWLTGQPPRGTGPITSPVPPTQTVFDHGNAPQALPVMVSSVQAAPTMSTFPFETAPYVAAPVVAPQMVSVEALLNSSYQLTRGNHLPTSTMPVWLTGQPPRVTGPTTSPAPPTQPGFDQCNAIPASPCETAPYTAAPFMAPHMVSVEALLNPSFQPAAEPVTFYSQLAPFVPPPSPQLQGAPVASPPPPVALADPKAHPTPVQDESNFTVSALYGLDRPDIAREMIQAIQENGNEMKRMQQTMAAVLTELKEVRRSLSMVEKRPPRSPYSRPSNEPKRYHRK